MMRSIPVSELTCDLVWDGLPMNVVTHGDTFQIRRIGDPQRRHHYQVWHAFAWKQDKLTRTQWRNCVNLAAAIQLMNRYS